ncbi:APC family permease [Algoriphagus namhaensis]|uniref:APC family permease n=1 Tax=Algoriphagus namhaensis TaxID=915353 RepID=A0ABV8AVX0_9BACT
MSKKGSQQSHPHLSRNLGLLGLMSTGVCSMIGASIYVIPFMIQRNVPGIGPFVLPAFLFAALPALFAAMAYATLASAMPRAGGSYLYASRALHPYLGFIASFSQWFGLSIVIGVISYVLVPFIRDFFFGLGLEELANWLEIGWIRVSISLMLLWTFGLINILGIKTYEKTLIPLMLLMFGLGGLVIISGFSYSQDEFIAALDTKASMDFMEVESSFEWKTFLAAAALLFSSFIGFDAIAQAGGEAKNPSKNLPRAIGLAILVVGGFYFTFTLAVYHTVPWQFVAQEAMKTDLTAAGLLSYLLPSWLGILILFGAAIALLNDLPAMILSVSRLVFSWAEDEIFPPALAKIHPRYKTPVRAILLSTGVATIGILGSHFAGDFFLGIDIMVTSMLVNFLLICLSLFFLQRKNPKLASGFHLLKSRMSQILVAFGGSILLSLFLFIHITKDLSADVSAWYFQSTWVWLLVMSLGSLIFAFRWNALKSKSVDLKSRFSKLPEA